MSFRKRIASVFLSLVLFTSSNVANDTFGSKEKEKEKANQTTTTTDSNTDKKSENSDNSQLDTIIDVGEYYQGDRVVTCFNSKNSAKITRNISTYFVKENGEIVEMKDKMTVKELQEIVKIGGLEVERYNCDWLNYCTNLKELTIIGTNEKNELINVNGKNLKYLEKLDVYSHLDSQNSKFIYELKNLKELNMGFRTKVDYEKIQNLNNLKSLTVNTEFINDRKRVDEYDSIDFKKFSNIDDLTIYGYNYELPIFLSNDDIAYLKKENVNIRYGNLATGEEININEARQLINNNNKLDEIVKNLNVKKDAKDSEKLHAIVEYMISNYTYASSISEKNSGNIPVTDDEYKLYYGSKNTKGNLYAPLTGNEVICANNSAMVRALAHRLGLEAHEVEVQGIHSFNLVKIDGAYYYVDLSFLKGQGISIKEEGYRYATAKEIFDDKSKKYEEYSNQIKWYKEDPQNYPGMEENGLEYRNHNVKKLPIDIDLAENHKKIQQNIDEKDER